MDRLIVNIDVTMGVVYGFISSVLCMWPTNIFRNSMPSGTLLSVCADFLKLQNTRDLRDLRKRQPLFNQLRTFLRGLKIEIQIPGNPARTAKPLRDLVLNVDEKEFTTKTGQTLSVGDHFRSVHNLRLAKDELGVVIGRHEVFPISVCVVPQQLYKVCVLMFSLLRLFSLCLLEPSSSLGGQIDDGKITAQSQ